jgi:SAM-dependent methyltransferase
MANLVSELKVEVCHRKGVAVLSRLVRAGGATRLNVGCGGRVRPGWTNIDVVPPAEVRLDIRRPLPVPDGHCQEIYSEHVLEHLRFPGEVESVLRDWHRALGPDGVVCIGVPDSTDVLRAYVAREEGYFSALTSSPGYPEWAETPLDHVNFHFRQQAVGFGQDHRYAYDRETLVARLRAAGFARVESREFDPEQDSRPGTMYLLGRKA